MIFIFEVAASAILFVIVKTTIAGYGDNSAVHDIEISGPPVSPHIVFACEMGTDQLHAFWSNPVLISDLQDLKAGISLALVDLSPERAQLVQQLNRAAIPVTAWIALPKSQGYYLNAGNAGAAASRFVEFEKWTSTYHLRWASIGLDIEPSVQDFAEARSGTKWRLAATLIQRCFDGGRVGRARHAYSELIRRMQARGFSVETYQFPFIADERSVHSTVLERLFGIVDVRGNLEALMLYSSFNHVADSGLIWEYGPDAQAIVVGVTSGDNTVPVKFAPLSWNELSRDLVTAAHFTRVVAIYNLEGCVQRGYLDRLKTFDWSQPITIKSKAIEAVVRLRVRIQTILWTASHFIYFAVVILLLDLSVVWVRRRNRAAI